MTEDLRGSIGRASRRSADAWHGGEATDRRARKNSRKKSVQGLTNEGSRGEIGRRARGRLEGGARAGLVAPDDTTYEYLKGLPMAPKGAEWEAAEAYWRLAIATRGSFITPSRDWP